MLFLPNHIDTCCLSSKIQVASLFKKFSLKTSSDALDEFDQIPSMGNFVVVCNGQGDSDPMKAFLAQYANLLQRLGFAGFMGACSAIAFKRVSRNVASIIGVAFVGIQALSYCGYVKIDYDKISGDAQAAMDVNGDGKLDENDLYHLWDKVKDVLTYNLPSAGSFSAGFLLGLRYA